MEEQPNVKSFLNNENFIVPREITVTITLEEYRRLIQTAAKAEVYKQQKTESELKQEIERLKNQVFSLSHPRRDDDCYDDCCNI